MYRKDVLTSLAAYHFLALMTVDGINFILAAFEAAEEYMPRGPNTQLAITVLIAGGGNFAFMAPPGEHDYHTVGAVRAILSRSIK